MNIHAPYNFVPLSKWIFKPDWADRVSQDIPFEDGLSGVIEYTVTAHTPIAVGSQQTRGADNAPGLVSFFRLPDAEGTPAIPGSSLRGMIRSVLEIASFAKMRAVDDRRYSVRDLTPAARHFYGSIMSRTSTKDKKPSYEPTTKAGWLHFDDSTKYWAITPCEFSRVEHDDLNKFHGAQWFDKNSRHNSVKKYEAWGRPREIRFNAGPLTEHRHSIGNLRYSKAKDLGNGSLVGTLVFTGQPSPKKHLEFIFHSEKSGAAVPVSSHVWTGFQDIYAETAEWQFWKKETRVPVFYLESANEKTEVSSLGLALMYKLAYKNTIVDVIRHTNPLHASHEFCDLPELIFGTVQQSDTNQADAPNLATTLKGRINFGHAQLKAGNRARIARTNPTILNGPKPTYYPNYVRQMNTVASGMLDHDKKYITFMDDHSEIRGWKRYPVKPSSIPNLTHEQQENKKVQVVLETLDAGAEFVGVARFHNLRPAELGSVLWAMTWGNDPTRRHSVGMGKSFGLGQVSMKLTSDPLRRVAGNKPGSVVPAVAELIDAFRMTLRQAYPSDPKAHRATWDSSEQVVKLLAMADPAIGHNKNSELVHMQLVSNDFVVAKQARQVLPEYVNNTAGTGPGDQWVQERVAAITKKHKNDKETPALRGEDLAVEWSKIADAELKRQAFDAIKARWETTGGWESVTGKSTKAAKKIYASESVPAEITK